MDNKRIILFKHTMDNKRIPLYVRCSVAILRKLNPRNMFVIKLVSQKKINKNNKIPSRVNRMLKKKVSQDY